MRWLLTTTVILATLGGVFPVCAGKPPKKDDRPPGLDNKAVVTFCKDHLNKKVGSGECAHLAIEALRVAGGEFVTAKFGDQPDAGDYVWGTLVKRLTWNGSRVIDSSPKAKCQAGDVVQFRNATFTGGRTAPHHTAIVAAVDARGRPTSIYEQNGGGPAKRQVTKETIDFTSLTGGWVRIYRPSKPKRDARMPTEFTLVNRTDKPVHFTFGGKQETLSEYDSERGFRTYRYGGAVNLVVGRSTIRPGHRKGYEVYQANNGKIALREVK